MIVWRGEAHLNAREKPHVERFEKDKDILPRPPRTLAVTSGTRTVDYLFNNWLLMHYSLLVSYSVNVETL